MHHLSLATLDDLPPLCALLNVLFRESAALGERLAMLEDRVVAPAARGQGTGSALLTDGHNAAAQHFYARHGFQASAMDPMRLALG